MKPLLKWVGGKTQLLSEIKARISSTWNKETDGYVEPFFGGGALFFDLEPKGAILVDRCDPLMEFYEVVKYASEVLTETLSLWAAAYNTLPEAEREAFYLQIRREFNSDTPALRNNYPLRAAHFYFINKVGFNGLYRENASGGCNVPWGKRARFNFEEEQRDTFFAASDLLRQQHWDNSLACFSAVNESPVFPTTRALIYCDPPYLDTFSNYNGGGFTFKDHLRLALWATDLREKGNHVILSNANHPDIISIYQRLGWQIDLVDARRNVNSNGAGRGAIKECLIY